jgi:WD40 repeat protein
VTTVADRAAAVWDWKANSNQPVARLRHEDYVVEMVGFTPDGQYLFTGGMDITIRLWEAWDTATPREVARLRPNDHYYQHHIAFSSDGKYLGTAQTGDHRVNLWLWRPKDLVSEACSVLTGILTAEEWDRFRKANNHNTCESFKYKRQ